MSELHLERLLGRQVLAQDGRPVGRIEEIEAADRDDRTVITGFLIGQYGLLERFSAWRLGRALLDTLWSRSRQGGYRIDWDQLDLSDPSHPRLTLPVSELKRAEVQAGRNAAGEE